jgi:hypothetical protein
MMPIRSFVPLAALAALMVVSFLPGERRGSSWLVLPDHQQEGTVGGETQDIEYQHFVSEGFSTAGCVDESWQMFSIARALDCTSAANARKHHWSVTLLKENYTIDNL